MSEHTPTTWPGMLWGQLMNDDERLRFLRDGGGTTTGIMAPAIVDDIVELIETRRDLEECLRAMVAECSQWPGGSASGRTIDRAAALLERLGM